MPLCNFTARITEVVTRNNGAEQTAYFTLAGTLPGDRGSRPSVPAANFVEADRV